MELEKFPKWDDYRFKENAEVEYIKAFEKSRNDLKVKLTELKNDRLLLAKYSAYWPTMEVLKEFIGEVLEAFR